MKTIKKTSVRFKLIPPMISVTLLSACATTKGPVFRPELQSGQEAIIYFYREYAFAGSVFSAYVSVDGKDIVRLPNEGYFAFKTKPGQINIKSTGGIMERNLTLNVEPGQSYYVRTGGIMSENDFILVLMKSEIGKTQIKNNHLQLSE